MLVTLRHHAPSRIGFDRQAPGSAIRSRLLSGVAIAFAILVLQSAHGQQFSRPVEAAPKSAFAFETGSSVGNIHICCYADDRRLSLYEIEYDRRWGRFLGSQADYVGAVLPLVVVNEPARYGVDSRALTTARQNHYGVGLAPLGVRLMWRPEKSLRPYLVARSGVMYFPNRILSSESMKLNFFPQYGAGMEKSLASGLIFRLEYNDVHISNGDVARRNPGIDFMYINLGMAFQLHRFKTPR